MRLRTAIWITVLLCVMVWGCQNEIEPNTDESSEAIKKDTVNVPSFDSIATDQVFSYSCGDSLHFSAHVTKDSTWLFIQDKTVKVLPVEAGSGARYEGNKYIYWSKGDEAILQQPEGSFMTCRSMPKERSWAAAKLRGIDFRAVGQEPGWHLELTKEGKTRYVGNYGQDSLSADTPEPTKSGEDSTEFNIQTEGKRLKIAISDTPCTDSMNGMEFPHTVTVTVNDDTYRGCGRYLR